MPRELSQAAIVFDAHTEAVHFDVRQIFAVEPEQRGRGIGACVVPGKLYNHQALTQKNKLADRRDSSFGLKVMPVSVIRIDDRYLAQRNIPKSKTLAGKKIALVGCGTIGGYLSDMLVKAGAGTCGGQLTLVDFDGLLPQNIGRHRLGLSAPVEF